MGHMFGTLTLCQLKTPQWVLWQTVKTPGDEMLHNAPFHKGLQGLLRQYRSAEKEMIFKIFFGNYNL